MTQFTKQHAWFGLFVLVVFGLGVGAGLTLARFLPPPGFARPGPGAPGRAPRPSDVVERMTRDLELSADQQQKLRVVLQNADARFERLRAASRDQFEALRKQLDDEIEQVLTEDQRTRFRALMAERRGGFPGPRRGPLGPHEDQPMPPDRPPPAPPGDQPPAPPPR